MIAPPVLFFGDDVIAGVEDPSCLGLVGRLLVRARQSGHDLIGYNLGVVGDTSLAVSRRWRKEAGPRVPEGNDWHPVFCVGTNDVAPLAGHTKLDMPSSTLAMQKIAARTAWLGLGALVIGPVPLGPPDQQRRVLALSQKYSELCKEYGVRYCETARHLASSNRWNSDLDSNGGRPREDGYDELARVVAEDWLELLARRRR